MCVSHVPPRHREEGWVPVPVLERGDGRLHTHMCQHVTSLPQRRLLQHHKATEVVAGASQRAKLHVCANVGGGGARYLGTRDWHRGSKTVELWVRTILLCPADKANITKKICTGTRNRLQKRCHVTRKVIRRRPKNCGLEHLHKHDCHVLCP